ncbi:MAG: sulfotransferase family protein [Acidimicrobiales bacterium]
MSPIAAGQPLFLLCSPRSGSTLLTRLLGMHERIAAPAETNLSVACQLTMNAAATLGQEDVDDEASAKAERRRALTHARRMATGIIRSYLDRRGAEVFVDKSLTNVDHAALLAECFPGARFICLHRHCLDVVYSLIEASPWGFEAYGAAPFVASHSFVPGLVDKWIGTTRAAVAFATAHPSVTTVVRYEDLVRDPVKVVGGLLAALGFGPAHHLVPPAPGGPVLLDKHANTGPLDYKIAFTNAVDTASIERGRRLPVAAIAPPLLAAANELLEGLGYAAMDERWNREVTSADPPLCGEGGRATLEVLVAQLEKRLARGTDGGSWRARVALEDVGSTVVVDFETATVHVEDGWGDPFCVSQSGSLLAAVLGHVNVGTLLRRGELRICHPERAVSGASEEGQLDTLLELLVPPAPDRSALTLDDAAGQGASSLGRP